jgi:hypothetical protein
MFIGIMKIQIWNYLYKNVTNPEKNMLNKGNNKIPNSEQSYNGKIKTHNYINRQNQSTTGKL